MVVSYASVQDSREARRWAETLGLPCVAEGEPRAADLSLVVHEGVLSLRDARERGLRPLQVDFETAESPSKKQPLGRAIGRRTRTVVDATAGWGEDARRLCHMGYSVTLLERNPVMAALLRNAAERAAKAHAPHPAEVIDCDAIDYLASHPGRWDCVYVDPMFPPKRRSSTLPRRSLRLLRELAGDDPDRQRLFEAAMAAGAKRVVVKRPDHRAPAFGRPQDTVEGKLVCYDVYFPLPGSAG